MSESKFKPNSIEHLDNNVIKMILNKGFYCLFNSWHYNKIKNFRWFVVKRKHTYYVQRTEWLGNNKTKIHFLHKIIMDDTNLIVDHKDRNGLNNLDENLRECTYSQNAQNRIGNIVSQSGHKCIFIKKNRIKKYEVRIGINKRRSPSKSFEFLEDAIKYRDDLIIELHGEFARTNNDQLKRFY